jgi:formamidopyrimidine-DNA glycosylase
MPELPEVETTRMGLAPHLEGRRLIGARVRDGRLRRPVPPDLGRRLVGLPVEAVERRAKYLLLRTPGGGVIIHLGMSGSLRVLAADTPPAPHDHLDLLLDDGRCLRLRDPRRFGTVLWQAGDPLEHPLLAGLGPEPLGPDFSGAYLFQISRHRRATVKALIMDARLVAGVGNIYASEALYRARIHPRRAAGRVSLARYGALAHAVGAVLAEAIAAGGTTLRDFTAEDGRPGYFRQALRVYAREGEPCPGCGAPIRREVIAQRASYYCPRCQR